MINDLKMDLNEYVNKFSQAVQGQDEILNNYNTKSSKQIEVLQKKKKRDTGREKLNK